MAKKPTTTTKKKTTTTSKKAAAPARKTTPSTLKFHTNQGVVLFITNITLLISSWILGALFGAMRLWVLIPFTSTVVWIGILLLMILGIINAVNGVMKPLPGNREVYDYQIKGSCYHLI